MVVNLDKLSEELSSMADFGLRKAQSDGAEESEIFISNIDTLDVQIETGILKARQGAAIGVGVRVVVDGKVGFAAASGTGDSNVKSAVEEAVTVAKIRPPDPKFIQFPDPVSARSQDGLIDNALLGFSHVEALKEIGVLVEATFGYDKRIKSMVGGVGIQKGVFAVANSRGISSCSQGALIGGGVYCIAFEGKKQKTGVESLDSRRLLDFSEVGAKAAKRAVKMLDAKPFDKSLKTTTVWENVAIESLLKLMVSSAVSGRNVQEGKSYFKGKKNERVASDVVTIIDDGQLPEGLMTFKTDMEGVPSQSTTLIERGILKNYIYDSYSAFQEERQSTGNANRQWPEPFLHVPTVSTTNLVFKTGTKNLDELVERVDEGILITGFVMGVGHSNQITGEFSVVAPNAFFVKNGEIKHPLEPVTVAGNFFSSLKKMTDIGSDPKVTSVGKIPSLTIEDLTVSG